MVRTQWRSAAQTPSRATGFVFGDPRLRERFDFGRSQVGWAADRAATQRRGDVDRDRGGDRDVQALREAGHGDLVSAVARREQFVGKPGVLAAEDQIPVLVFDEVDANIGGETANAVGEKMQQIAQKRQVLCITHLPQVAAPASAHYVATKLVKGGRTVSEITLLDPKERVTELARMLGGQSDAARRHAEALLKA